MKRTYIVKALEGKNIEEEILVKGWVRTRRDSKGGSHSLNSMTAAASIIYR